MKNPVVKFKNWFHNLNLSKKMMSVYILLFGSFAAISIIAIQLILSVYDNKLYGSSREALNFFVQTVNRELHNVEKISYSVALNTDLQKQLSDIMSLKNKDEYMFRMSSFRGRLLVEAMKEDIVANVFYTDRNFVYFDVAKTYIQIPEDRYQNIIDKAKEAEGAYVYTDPTEDFPYLLSGRDILKYSDASLEYLGTVLFVCNINQIIKNSFDALNNSETSLYVYSEDGIIYSNDAEQFEQILPLNSEKGYDIVTIGRQKYFVCQIVSKETGWTYVNMFPYSSIFYMNSIIRYLMMAGFLILLLISGLLMRKVAAIISHPLEELKDSMAIVEQGEFKKAKDCLGNTDSKDEMGALQKSFGIMLDRIVLLIRENYEKQLVMKESQYQALQAQINPHFLYNTLNSVRWTIKAGSNEEASRMVVSLGNLLHAAFSKESLIRMTEEVKFLEDYLNIQKLRYDSRAVFTVFVCEEAKNYMVPRMLLQPLVENAIYYGVDNSLKSCEIRVTIQMDGDKLAIQVSDDGPGMDERTLEEVRNFTVKPKGNGIGLKNIRDRLELLFTDKYEFKIDSQLGQGTTVTIKVPKYEEQNGSCIK